MVTLLRNLLKFSQFCSVIIIFLVIVRFLLPKLGIFEFAQPLLDLTATIIGSMNTVYNGTDFKVAFLMAPWIIWIVVAEILMKWVLTVKEAVVGVGHAYNTQKVAAIAQQKKNEHIEVLRQKQAVYAVIELVFAKFTISDISEAEIELKKEDVKTRLIEDAMRYKGKAIEGLEFENDDSIAIIFLSQEEALNFIFKIRSTISIFDDDLQNFGYTLRFKAVLDSQNTSAQQYDIFEFLEKVIHTSEDNEICVTQDFAQRYNNFGNMKHVKFNSKGTYSLSRKKVDLYRLEY